MPSLLKEVSNPCCLPSMLRSAPGFTYIPLTTTATSYIARTNANLKPKVQGSNPAHNIFSSHHHVYACAHACVWWCQRHDSMQLARMW